MGCAFDLSKHTSPICLLRCRIELSERVFLAMGKENRSRPENAKWLQVLSGVRKLKQRSVQYWNINLSGQVTYGYV